MINIAKPFIGKEEIDAVTEVLRSGMLAQGPKTEELETKFAKFCGTKYAVAVSNGTSGIHCALHALEIGPGDEVITTPFTFVGTANPVLMQGAKVVFCDISEDDYCIDPEKLEEKITQKTKAIIPVDLYGQIYQYEKVKEIADKHKLSIIEDACQAIGAEQNDVKAGNFGNLGVFSLYATKNITTGEGGIIVTNNKVLMEKCRMFRHHGQDKSKRYEYFELGYNYRTTDICSAIGIEQLKKLKTITKKRRNNAAKLHNGLKNIKGIILPKTTEGNSHVYHQYTIRITQEYPHTRDEVIKYLKENEIGAGVYYPKPLHLQPHFSRMGYQKGDFPVSEKVSKQVISLPVHPGLSNEDIEHIVDTIISFK